MKREKTIGALNVHYAALQAAFNMAYAVVYAFASAFLLARGFANTMIGVLIALPSGLAVFVQPAIASYADRPTAMPVRRILLWLLAIAMGGAVLMAVVPLPNSLTAVLFTLLNVIVLCGMGLVNALGMAHVDRGVPVNYGLARGIGSVSFAVVSLLLGRLLVGRDASLLLPWSFVVALALFFLSTFVFPAAQRIARETESQKGGALAFMRRYPRYPLFLTGATLLYVSHLIFNNYLLQIFQYFGGGSAEFGTASAMAALLELPMMALFAVLVRRIPVHLLLRTSCVAFAVKALVLLFAHGVVGVFVCQLFQFFAFALYIPSAVYYTNCLMRGADKVKGQGYNTVTMMLGSVIGSLLGGRLLDVFDVPGVQAACFVSAALGAVIACLAVRRIEPEQ